MMKYKAVLFDMDGTLLDTLTDLADAVNHILSVHGYPLRTVEEVRIFVGNGARRLMERALPPDVTGDAFEALRPQQGFVIGRWQVFPKKEVIDQITPLERIGYRKSSFRRRNGRRSGDMQIREHPLLFDGVDAVDQPSLGVPDLENPVLERQNLLRVLLSPLGVLAQQRARAFDHPHDGILARLQRRLFAQHLHILRIAFQSRDTRRHLLRRGFGGTHCDQHRQKEKSFTHHLHHFRKNN